MFKLMRQVFTTSHRRRIRFLTVLFIINAFVETYAVILFYPFMNSVLNPDAIDSSSWYVFLNKYYSFKSNNQALIMLGIGIILFYIFKAFYRLFIERLRNKWFVKIRTELTEQIFSSILYEPYIKLSQKNTSDIQRNLTLDVNNIFLYLDGIMSIIRDSAMGVMFLIMLFFINAGFTFILIAIFGVLFICTHIVINRKAFEYGKKNRESYFNMVKVTSEVLGTLKFIATNKRQQPFINRYTTYSREHAKQECNLTFFRTIPQIMYEAVVIIGMIAYILVLISHQADIGEMIPGFVTFALATVKLIPVVSRITSGINSMIYYTKSMEQVGTLLNIKCDCDTEIVQVEPYSIKDGIFIRNASFHYPDSKDILTNISMDIPRGMITGIIGVTGAGKTTLIDLILGLYSPDNGCIMVDDIDINVGNILQRVGVGYVPQRVNLFDDTIRHNVAIGLEDNDIDDDRVWKCLCEARMDDFVRTLPNGINEMTGENGARLSGGQVQRIGIARALYYDPEVIVLDESTNALDMETELQILNEIQSFKGYKTILLISHRESSINMCDYVYKVENNSVYRTK